MVLGEAAYMATSAVRERAFGANASALRASQRSSSSSSFSNNSSHNNLSGKFMDDPSFVYGSVLDQLHAEQKSTIEALTCQVEFYRQREERYKKELDTLRRCTSNGSDAKGDEVARLARENRELGEALDSLEAKQRLWAAEKARANQQRLDMERQLKDARHTLTGFAQAVEQLEVKMQRKEAEVQAKCLELEQQLRDKALECSRLVEESARVRQHAENLQTANDENQRLWQELLALASTENRTMEASASSSLFSSEIQRVREKMQSLDDAKRRQEQTIRELEQKVSSATAEVAAAQLEAERKRSEIKELKLQLENASSLMSLREQLHSTDDSSRKENEQQRQELLALVAGLQREKSNLQDDVSAIQKELKTAKDELLAAKTRMTSKDHVVMVSTLRSEIASLKDRLRGEFKQEKEGLQQEKQSLSQEIAGLHARISEKDRAIYELQRDVKKAEEKQRQFAYDERHLRDQISNLQRELEQSRLQYQQLQNVRTSLAEQLDVGFKALLDNEESAASAREDAESLRQELAQLKKELARSESDSRSVGEELELARRQHDEAARRMNDKIDDLYRQLLDKDDAKTSVLNMQRRLELAEEEKATWEGQVTDMRLRSERRLEVEVRKVEDLRAKVNLLSGDKATLSGQVAQLEAQIAESAERVHDIEAAANRKERELDTERRELTDKISQLEEELERATGAAAIAHQEKQAREKKLLREREQLEREMTKLVSRIEQLGQRNLALGDKVVELAQQSKSDQTNLVALSAQVKSYKRHVKQLEEQLGNAVRSSSARDLTLQVREATCLNESYKLEMNKLEEALASTQHDLEASLRDRDEAEARARALMQCQEHLKAAVEGHTTELVEEIEALQHQLESERKRCALLLANEKTLVRDLQERNAAIGKLQRSISAPKCTREHDDRRRSSEATSLSSSRSSSASGEVSRRRRSRTDDSPRSTDTNGSRASSSAGASTRDRVRSKPNGSDSPRSTTTATTTTMAETELDQLLRNLEHISELSSQQQPTRSGRSTIET